jgi:hypothetical protein
LPKIKFNNWSPIFLIIAIGISLRLYKNFSTTLIPGINGGYYPFQVKLILENFRLGFNDMPFVFYFQAFIVKILTFFIDTNIDTLIINTSKIVDSVFPTLVVLPIFILARKQFEDKPITSNIYIIALCAYSILSISSISMLCSDYQKNAVGIVWLASSCLGVYFYLKSGQLKYIYITLVFVVLNLITHIGTLGAFVFFILITFSIIIVTEKKKLFRHLSKITVLICLAIIAVFILQFIDLKRFERLIHFISSPLSFFENPVIYFLLNNNPKTIASYLGSYIIFNSLGIFGLLYLLKKKYLFEKRIWVFAVAISLTGLFMCSPLIGVNWSFRFLWISYIFIIIQYVFVFSVIANRRNRLLVLSFFLLTLLIFSKKSIQPKKTFISEDSYAELITLKDKIKFDDNTIILTTHGLEWWTGFSLNTYIGQDYSLTIKEFNKYSSVYVLIQKKGNNFENSGWSHFLDVEVPITATKKFDGDFFQLYQLNEPLNFDKSISAPPLTFGEIITLTNEYIVLENMVSKYKVIINNTTRIELKASQEKSLKEGMKIEIWGNRVPFSDKIEAHTIHQIN